MAYLSAAEAAINVLRLPPMPTTKELLSIYKLRALKQLSQNFLLDPKLTDKIVKYAGKVKGHHVLEVGPGPGNITRKILERGARKVLVVEKDTRFKPCLDLLADAVPNQLDVIYGDILETRLDNIFPQELRREWGDKPPNISVIGNLPFSVSTPLIIRWLKMMSERSGIFAYGRVHLTLTFQEEVAQRMIADILQPQRSRLSIMCQYLANVKHMFTINGESFIPKPEVDVGVVHFSPLIDPLIKQPFHLVEKVMRNVFHHRQKTITKGFLTLFPKHLSYLAHEIVKEAEVDPQYRCYHLGIDELKRVCDVYSDMCDKHQGLAEYDYRAFPSIMELKRKLDVTTI